MASFFVSDNFAAWVGERVTRAFEQQQIPFSETALALFAMSLEAQVIDQLVRSPDDALERAERMLKAAPEVYLRMYGKERMTLNRAMHLLVELNHSLKQFPWGPSVSAGER